MALPDGEINPTGNAISVSDFPQFDVIAADPSDHAYYGSPNNGTADFHKKVMQEWKVLDGNLPETIFVRVYETRISLLRAAIAGAHGTPYQDGLFFFDIFLPSNYPSVPPQVKFRSFGFQINPNLYNTGDVCLSLLNTWFGNTLERWDPNKSTILQVLVSIQALVLNEKPYYNEPGLGLLRWTKLAEKSALHYNQQVFLLCCKSVLCLLRTPPTSFEPLVAAHFRERGVSILSACNGYRSGIARVGGDVIVGDRGVVSKRFRGSVELIYRELMVALDKNGAPVDRFVEQWECEMRAKANGVAEKAEMKKTKGGGGGLKERFMAILQKIWVGSRLKKNSSVANDQVEVKVVN